MAESTPQPKAKHQPSAAFLKPVQPDQTLAAIIGSAPVPRTELTRKLWEYIRSHNLQDPQNKTFIRADENLKQVFDGKDRVSMIEMTKLVNESPETTAARTSVFGRGARFAARWIRLRSVSGGCGSSPRSAAAGAPNS